MFGPRKRLTIRSAHLSVNTLGVLVLWGLGWIVLTPEMHPGFSPFQVAAVAALVACACMSIMWVLEQSIGEIARPGTQIGPCHISAAGAVTLWSITSGEAGRRLAVIGYLVYGGFGLVFLLVGASLQGQAGPVRSAAFVLAVFVGASCLVRLCPIRGFPGGYAAGRYFDLLGDDDDLADSAGRIISYGSGLTFLLSGLLVLAHPGPWTGWGLAGVAIGFECMLLTQWHAHRTRWAAAAASRPLKSISHSRLPTIPHSAPISELLSIFAVEGPRAMVVVIDDTGQPSGVIQLRQLKTAVHSGASTHPDEVMVTLSAVPHFPPATTVLDAAIYLEHTGNLALVTEGASGKLRVVSLEELLRIVD